MSGRLQGKRTLITGTASGIGRAAARLFAAEGARLTLCDRLAAENQQLADEIVSGGGIAQAMTAGEISGKIAGEAIKKGTFRRRNCSVTGKHGINDTAI